MGTRSFRTGFLATAVTAMVFAGACAPPTPAPPDPTDPTVPVVVVPGPFHLAAGGGAIEFGTVSLDVAAMAPTFSGTVEADGGVTVPAAGITFAPVTVTVADHTVSVRPLATADASGHISTDGTTTLDVSLRLLVQDASGGGQPLVVNPCHLGSAASPLQLRLTTGTTDPPGPNGPVTGVRHDRLDGSLTLVDNGFGVPGAVGCGLFGSANPSVDAAFGTPSAAGTNSAVLEGVIDPPVLAGG